MKRIILVLPWLLVLALGGILLVGGRQVSPPLSKSTIPPTPSSSPTFSNSPDTFLVTRVIDGDTIEITGLSAQAGGKKLRYIGIDTPEAGDCLGNLAAQKNKELVLGKEVRLEKDVSETDKYGRLLRYVFSGELFVNEELVRSGFAKVSTFPPDIKYVEKFLAAEKEARENKRGLWSTDVCNSGGIEKSTETQDNSTTLSAITSNCIIKGNISASSEKIYHMPGCGSYEKTRINEENGEQWFCSEEEAVTAGWRKAKNCP